MVKLLPYNIGSQSAKVLARSLGVKRIIPNGHYRPTWRTLVINWGNSSPHFTTDKILNKPEAVRNAANKLSTLTILKQAGLSVPDFTTDINVAEGWLRQDYKVVVRHKLSAHSGEGIEIVRPEERLPHAPLYTKYTRKINEYRVHVFNGEVIDFSEKKKRYGGEDTNSLIRSHDNGWVFCRDGVRLPDNVSDAAIKAVRALGLDFGALDIIYRDGKYWILECNTAPGLEGTTLASYVDAIRNYARQDLERTHTRIARRRDVYTW